MTAKINPQSRPEGTTANPRLSGWGGKISGKLRKTGVQIMYMIPRKSHPQTDGDHDNGNDRFPDQRPEDHPFHDHPKDKGAEQGNQEGHIKGGLKFFQDGQADKGPQGHEIAHGQVQDAGGLVDQHKAQGDQPIDAAGGQAADQYLG